ncbi:MAG: hypothetical protein OJF51_000901 [Nitrospira sp.]|nr:MAG: hypothetical protein OJF51_000901 [Nitrospira sp.]
MVGKLEHERRTIQPAETISPVVDLTNVTFVGEDGKLLLKRMWREGAQLIAAGCCTGHLAKEITRSPPNGSSVDTEHNEGTHLTHNQSLGRVRLARGLRRRTGLYTA